MEQHRCDSSDERIFDSGTSSHMCRDREKAVPKEAKEISNSVIVADNMETPVVTRGNVTIKADLGDATEVLDVSCSCTRSAVVVIGWYSLWRRRKTSDWGIAVKDI